MAPVQKPHTRKLPHRDERGRFAPIVNVTVNVQQFPNGDMTVDAEAEVVEGPAPIGFRVAEHLEDGTALDAEEEED